MSFPSKTNFDISLVERTILNFNKFYDDSTSSNEYEFTFLLNSLLGLLFIPNEYYFQEKRRLKYDFLKKKADRFTEIKRIFDKDDSIVLDSNKNEYRQKKFMYKTKSGNEKKLGEITLGSLLNRMRNSIAHCHIIPTKDENSKTWKGIILRNYPVKKNNYFNFEVYLTQEEIKNFALFIANKYTNTSKIN